MKIYSAQFKGTTTVSTGSNVSLTGSFSGSIYGFDDTIQYSSSVSSDLSNLESKSASVDISISNINSVTASNIARLSNLESKSASVDISISNINQYTGSNDTKWTTLTNVTSSLIAATGSYATTGSNTFFGTQTFSGSVYIANDLIVQGSSSIQYISASSVSIGTNIVQLNTANPSVRFAGLSIIDSGSIGGSGSFLYDSLQDEFIFVHRGNGTNITSSHFVLGPETYDSLGNETYLTCNIITKGTGKEHLVDSCIFDNGTTTCIKNNLVGTGTACFASSTQAGGFYANGTTTITTPFDTTTSKVYFDASCINGATLTLISDSTGRTIRLAATTAATYSGKIDINTSEMNMGTNVALPFTLYTNQCPRITTTSTGITCFSCQVCINTNRACGTNSTTLILQDNATGIQAPGCGLRIAYQSNGAGTYAAIGMEIGGSGTNNESQISFYTQNVAGGLGQRLSISSTGNACFYGQICACTLVTNGGDNQQLLVRGAEADIWLCSTGGGAGVFRIMGSTGNATRLFRIYDNNNSSNRLTIDVNGITNFVCQVCTPFISAASVDVSTGGASCPTTACVGYGIFGYSGVGLGITAGASGGNQGIGFFVCGVERGRWISSGNLGIGTVCPGYPLTVYSTNTGHIKVENPNVGGYALYQAKSNGSAYVWQWGAWSDGSYRVGQSGVGDYMTINTTGKVMIGGTDSTGNGNFRVVGICQTSYTRVAAFYETHATGIPYITVGKQSEEGADTAAVFAYNNNDNVGWIGVAGDSYGTGLHIKRGNKVGIGISNPTRELHIAAPNSTLRVGPDYPVLNSSTDRDYIDLIAGGSQSIIAAPNESFLIINTGGGGASPCIDIQAGGAGGVRLTNTATSWAGISDIRAKDIIEPVTNAVAKLSNLSTIIYKLKGDETNQRKIGLIAQEVNEVLPEVVDVPINSCVMWGVRYSEIVPVLVKAIQEQQCTICTQASMINILKSCIGIV
jgi:hypothetical protein